MGLVNAVVPRGSLDTEVARWCEEILAKSPTALRIAKAFLGPSTARLSTAAQRRLLRRNRLKHSLKVSFMSITSTSCCHLNCAARNPCFGKGFDARHRIVRIGRIAPSRRRRQAGSATRQEASRTDPGLPVELGGQGGPESFKGRRRAYAPRRIPDRFPVTAGIRSETATRPLDSARFSRRRSQRWMAVLPECSPSVPQGWPVWRLCLPFSSCPPFSSSWRFSSCLPPSSYQLFSTTSFSSLMMLFSSSFSFRLFSLFSSPFSISFKVVEQRKPGRKAPDYPTAGEGSPAPAC